MNKKLRAMLALAAMFGFAASAAASPISCSVTGYDVSAKVQGTQACERLTVTSQNSYNDSDTLINDQAFFGINQWTRVGKYDNLSEAPLDTANLFDFGGGKDSGTFTYVGDINALQNVMLVFKSGKNTNLVAYMLDGLTANEFKYTSPFIPGLFDVAETKGISHISVYTSARLPTIKTTDEKVEEAGKSTEVPEPATLALVGLGLAGIAMRRRRT